MHSGPFPTHLPRELPWGERAIFARYVTPAICLSLGWAPTELIGIAPINDKLLLRLKREARAHSGGARASRL